MTIDKPELDVLHQLRSSVASLAKLWWGFGVAFGYLAIVAVPFAWLVGGPDYVGPLAAVLLAISGRVCVWKSESYRKDAEWTIRTIELHTGIGLEVDATTLADLKFRYFKRLQRSNDFANDREYYEASGDPSPNLLTKRVRESSWWTGQLAKKASNLVFLMMAVVVFGAALVIIVGGLEVEGDVATSVSSEIFRRAYGLAICVILLLDTLSLGLKYHQLSVAAKESMGKLTALLDEGEDVGVTMLMTTVSDYQAARKEGPLIPDWFKCYHENTLQRVWDETLSISGESDSYRDRNP